MRTLSGYLIALSDKSTIDRIAKYNAEIYLTGIFHDQEMKHPIEISPEIFIGDNSMKTPIYEKFIEKLSVQKVREMSLSQFREIVQSDLIDLLHSTPTDAELEKFKIALTASEKCKVRNLPYRLARLSEELHFPANKEVFITCTAFGSASMLNIFPHVIREGTQEMTNIHSIHDILYIMKIKGIKVSENLERNDALKLILSMPCDSAVDLPEASSIIFCIENNCFYLTYGQSCMLGELDRTHLDLDGGFDASYNRSIIQPYKVVAALNIYFYNWKARNYQGDLFPNTLAICEAPAAAARMSDPDDSSSLARRTSGSQRFSFFAANKDESETAGAASAGPAPL